MHSSINRMIAVKIYRGNFFRNKTKNLRKWKIQNNKKIQNVSKMTET